MIKVIFGLITALVLSGCSHDFVRFKETKSAQINDLKSYQFIQGMKGAENLFLPTNSSKVYVTDLNGNIYLLDKNSNGILEVKTSYNIGKYALGIILGKDGYLYVNASQRGKKGWLKHGGEVYKIDTELKSHKKITTSYKGINGLTIDPQGDLYFSIGDLEFLFPDGAIYKMLYNSELEQYGQPKLFLDNLGSANGIFYSTFYDSLLFTETFSKLSKINMRTNKVSKVLGKTKIIEGFDDLCVDSKGRIWVAEPVGGFLKMYNPQNQKVTRFLINGLGVASSCGIRIEDGEEYIYVTEREIKDNDDGRGIIVLSIDELLVL